MYGIAHLAFKGLNFISFMLASNYDCSLKSQWHEIKESQMNVAHHNHVVQNRNSLYWEWLNLIVLRRNTFICTSFKNKSELSVHLLLITL